MREIVQQIVDYQLSQQIIPPQVRELKQQHSMVAINELMLPFDRSLMALYFKVMRYPSVWSIIIADLLGVQGYATIAKLAQAVQVAPRTISRLLKSKTKQPCFKTGTALLAIHISRCAYRYDFNISEVAGLTLQKGQYY